MARRKKPLNILIMIKMSCQWIKYICELRCFIYRDSYTWQACCQRDNYSVSKETTNPTS